MLSRAIAGGGYLVSGTLIQIALTFAGNLVLLRMLEPDEFGRFAVTLAALSLISSILSLRLGVVILRTSDAEFTLQIQRRYFNSLVAETILIVGISVVWLLALGRDTALDFMLLAAVVLQNFCGHNRAYWERTMPYRRAALLETAVVGASQLAGIIVVLATHDAAALYVREFTAAVALMAGLTIAGGLTWHRIGWLSAAEWRSVLHQCGGIWFDSMLEGTFQRVTVIATGLAAGNRGAGLFSMAQRIALTPHQVLMPVGRVALNWFSRTEQARDRRRGRDHLLVFFSIVLTIAAGGVALLADTVVPWLFGPHWREAVPAIVAMSGVMVFTTLFEITRGYALVLAKTRVLIAGRLAQFGGFAILGVVAYLRPEHAVEFLGLGLSLALALAFLTQLTFLRRSDNK